MRPARPSTDRTARRQANEPPLLFSLSPSAGEGRERGPSACGPRVLQTTSRLAEEALMPCPSPRPRINREHPTPPPAPASAPRRSRRRRLQPASVATRAGRKRNSPSPYPPPRWGEGLGCGRCAPGLLSTWAMAGGNATTDLRWPAPLPPLNCRSSETSLTPLPSAGEGRVRGNCPCLCPFFPLPSAGEGRVRGNCPCLCPFSPPLSPARERVG